MNFVTPQEVELEFAKAKKWTSKENMLGFGAYAYVYRIPDMTPPLVLKLFNQKRKDWLVSAQNEVEVLKSLKHRLVVKYLGEVVRNGDNGKEIVGIIMQQIERQSLDKLIFNPNFSYSMYTVVYWIEQLLIVLNYLQKNGNIAHRDIKPDNILVDHDYFLILGDFGCAKSSIEMITGTFLGTERYMPPETLCPMKVEQGPWPLLIRDIYSMGIVFWEIIERRKIFSNYIKYGVEGDYFDNEAFQSDLSQELIDSQQLDCPQNVKDLVYGCINFQPDKRILPASAAALIHEIREEYEMHKRDLDFEPLENSNQKRLLKPIGFDGKMECVEVQAEQDLELDFDKISFFESDQCHSPVIMEEGSTPESNSQLISAGDKGNEEKNGEESKEMQQLEEQAKQEFVNRIIQSSTIASLTLKVLMQHWEHSEYVSRNPSYHTRKTIPQKKAVNQLGVESSKERAASARKKKEDHRKPIANFLITTDNIKKGERFIASGPQANVAMIPLYPEDLLHVFTDDNGHFAESFTTLNNIASGLEMLDFQSEVLFETELMESMKEEVFWKRSTIHGQELPDKGYIFQLYSPPTYRCQCEVKCPLSLKVKPLANKNVTFSLPSCSNEPFLEYLELYFEFCHFLIRLQSLNDLTDLLIIKVKSFILNLAFRPNYFLLTEICLPNGDEAFMLNDAALSIKPRSEELTLVCMNKRFEMFYPTLRADQVKIKAFAHLEVNYFLTEQFFENLFHRFRENYNAKACVFLASLEISGDRRLFYPAHVISYLEMHCQGVDGAKEPIGVKKFVASELIEFSSSLLEMILNEIQKGFADMTPSLKLNRSPDKYQVIHAHLQKRLRDEYAIADIPVETKDLSGLYKIQYK